MMKLPKLSFSTPSISQLPYLSNVTMRRVSSSVTPLSSDTAVSLNTYVPDSNPPNAVIPLALVVASKSNLLPASLVPANLNVTPLTAL